MKTKKTPRSIVNKAALGELTIGEVWDLINKRVTEVRIEDEVSTGTYGTFHLTPGVSLGFSNGTPDEPDPDYSFDLDIKVKVREDHLELVYTSKFGDEEKLFLYFLFQPETEVIPMGFLLGK